LKTVKFAVFAMLLALGAATANSAGREIYPDPAHAKADIAAALKAAAATHKRVLLDFGGEWCGDCQVLDIYFHNSENLPILESNFVLVHVNIGQYDANLDIAGNIRFLLTTVYPRLLSSAKKEPCSIASKPASSPPCAAWNPHP